MNINDIYIIIKNQIVSILFILISCFSFNTQSQNLKQLSYREAAKLYISNSYQELYEHLNKSVYNEILPHEVKAPVDLRKLIVKSRDMIDLFIYSFSIESNGSKTQKNNKNIVRDIRKQLDEGYELFGLFKDIYDRQQIEDITLVKYEQKEVSKKRENLLVWVNKFNNQYKKFYSFLKENEYSGYDWNKKDLSQFYWGKIDLVPNIDENAFNVVNVFILNLIESTKKQYSKTKNIKSPIENDKTIEAYHDMRKYMRTIKKLFSYFTELDEKVSAKSKLFLTEFTDLYGKISDNIAQLESLNDEIKSIEKDKTNKDERKLKKLYQKLKLVKNTIENSWVEVINFEKRFDVKSNLNLIVSQIYP